MNSFLSVVAGLWLGIWLGPALKDISQKVWDELKMWWLYR